MWDRDQYEHPLYPRGPDGQKMTVAAARALVDEAVRLSCLKGNLLFHPSSEVPCVVCGTPSRTTFDPIRTVECNTERREKFSPDFYSLQRIALCKTCAGIAVEEQF
jgi:hypothetical protein